MTVKHGTMNYKPQESKKNTNKECKRYGSAAVESLTNYTSEIKESTPASMKLHARHKKTYQGTIKEATCKAQEDLSSLLKIQKVSNHKASRSSY